MSVQKPSFMRKAAGVLALALVLACSGWGVWFYQPIVHRQLVSPDGRYTAGIVKRYGFNSQPVMISLRITDVDSEQIEQDFYSTDMWEDVTGKSHPLKWTSKNQLLIGDRGGTFDLHWAARIDWPNLLIKEIRAAEALNGAGSVSGAGDSVSAAK